MKRAQVIFGNDINLLRNQQVPVLKARSLLHEKFFRENARDPIGYEVDLLDRSLDGVDFAAETHNLWNFNYIFEDKNTLGLIKKLSITDLAPPIPNIKMTHDDGNIEGAIDEWVGAAHTVVSGSMKSDDVSMNEKRFVAENWKRESIIGVASGVDVEADTTLQQQEEDVIRRHNEKHTPTADSSWNTYYSRGLKVDNMGVSKRGMDTDFASKKTFPTENNISTDKLFQTRMNDTFR